MTIQKAIDIAMTIRPGAFDEADAIRWLNEIDHQLYLEVVLTHENPDGIVYAEHTADNKEAKLLVSAPYDKLYPSYLRAKADEQYGEDSYNVSASIFNEQMNEFRRYYNRTHMPVSPTQPAKADQSGIVYVYPNDSALKE